MPPLRVFSRATGPPLRPSQQIRLPLSRTAFAELSSVATALALGTSVACYTTVSSSSKRTSPRRRPPQLMKLNLGNNIIAEVPVSSSSSSSNKKPLRRAKPKKEATHVTAKHAPTSPSAATANTHPASSAARTEAQLGDFAATATSEGGQEMVATDAVSTLAEAPSPSATRGFVVPQTAAEAAEQLDASTLLEALALPSSAAAFSLSLSLPSENSHQKRNTTARSAPQSADELSAAAEANFTQLRSTALPLLFAFAKHQLAMEQQQVVKIEEDNGVVQAADSSIAHSADLSLHGMQTEGLQAAVACLAAHVDFIAQASRRDGRRHTTALPPPVVAALWDRVMPFLHAEAFPVQKTRSTTLAQHDALSSVKENSLEEDNDSGSSGEAEVREGQGSSSAAQKKQQNLAKQSEDIQVTDMETRVSVPPPSSMPAPSTPAPAHTSAALKSSYLALRRGLALHTRHIAPLLPPTALATVLTRLYQCGALSDDILGPVVAEFAESQQQAQRQQHHCLTPASASSATVGGTIAILQDRVLRLNVSQALGVDEVQSERDEAVERAFRGAAAVTMARLLGKAAVPGHHQLHRFFHLALLPEVSRVLHATSESATRMLEEHDQAVRNRAAALSSHTNAGDEGRRDELLGGLTNLLPSTEALLDLTAAFRHYAVSGDAVQHLTSLWHLQFRLAEMADKGKEQATAPENCLVAWSGCGAVLRALSSVPVSSPRTQRRQARQQQQQQQRASHGAAGGRKNQLLRLQVAEEDYFTLVDEVCAQVRRLSAAAVAVMSSSSSPELNNDVAHQSGNVSELLARKAADDSLMGLPPPPQLLELLRMLLRVNSPHWAETYDALATAIFVQFASQLVSPSSPTTAATDGSADLFTLLTASFPLADTQRTLKALLRRNSLIPDHPLHRVLLRRILYAPEALTDPAVAATALIGLEVMVPVEEGSTPAPAAVHPPSSADATQDARTREEEGSATSDVVPLLPSDDFAITAQDRTRALRLLRRCGRSLNPTAFVAGLCVAPLHHLPLPTQIALVNHLSSVASAVSPTYLVKGMAAVLHQLSPRAIDDVSVQQWYSRFTARDVVRRVDAAGCAMLLDILSSHERYERNCALAKQAITRQIGVLLRRIGEEDDARRVAGSSSGGGGEVGTLTLEQLPHVIAALRNARVFLPPYFSRVCRFLLGQVESAPLGDLLLPFSAAAEEFMRRQQREAQASLFKDVWELLRGRVLDQAATLSMEETCTALSAFAALDVADSALFGVLVFQLWTVVQREVYPTTAAAGAAGADHTPRGKKDEDTQEVELLPQDADAPAAAASEAPPGVYADEAQVRRLAQMGQYLTESLTPSAVAVVVTTLCARADHGSTSYRGGEEEDEMVQTMLPWMLLALRKCHAELYPIDVVHVLPSLLQRYAALNSTTQSGNADSKSPRTSTNSSQSGVRAHATLLHAAYDACRSTFLSMYAALPELPALSQDATAASTPATTTGRSAVSTMSSAPHSTLTREEAQQIREQRAVWTPAVKLSVQVVPRAWFATLLLTLSSHDLADVDVGLACVERACTRRVCGAQLSIDQLVDLCLTMCWLFRVSDFAMMPPVPHGVEETTDAQGTSAEPLGDAIDEKRPAGSAAESVNASSVASPTSQASVLRTGMAAVLSALWFRSDELRTAHINALLRCLRDTYGADRVDEDFVQRLEAQRALIQKRREAAAAAAGAATAAETPEQHEERSNHRNAAPDATVLEAKTGAKLEKKSTTSDEASTSAPPPPKVEEMHADDLFSLM